MKPMPAVLAYIRIFAVNRTRGFAIRANKAPRPAKMMMRCPFWLLLLLYLSGYIVFGHGYARGTTIAAVRTDDAVSIAADSRVVDGSGKRMPDSCKILGAGGYFFALHGAVSDEIIAVIRRALSNSSGNLFDKARMLQSSLLPLMMHGMAGRSGSSGVILLGVEQGQPELAYLAFDAFNGETTIRYCPGVDCRASGIGLASATVYGSVLPISTRSIEDVRTFVWTEITMGKSDEERTGRVADVGEPLQSLVLHRDGTHERPDNPDVCKNEP